MALVSVIIPNYNHAKFLQQRVESVLNQTYLDIEVIILDDDSTDSSKEIIEKYRGHPKVTHVIYNDKNSGSVFMQWQKGIKLAEGEYIWIAESDDYAHTEFLENMVPYIEQDKELALVYSNAKILFENGEFDINTFSDRRNRHFKTNKWSSNYINSGKDEIIENLLEQCTINNASSVLFRKDALLTIDPFDREFKYIGDWYTYLKLCSIYKVGYLDKVLNFYRDHSINASKNLYKSWSNIFEFFILFDWSIKHLKFVEKQRTENLFIKYTKHNFLANWSMLRVRLYHKLLLLNPELFWKLVRFNISKDIKERFLS